MKSLFDRTKVYVRLDAPELSMEEADGVVIRLRADTTAARAGITKHVTPHVLRHSFATDFILNNGGIRHLSLMMGHASVDTTLVYTHVADNDLEKQYRKYHSYGGGKTVNIGYSVVDNRCLKPYNQKCQECIKN